MNIAHIVFGMTVGGIETMLANIASEQSLLTSNRVAIVIINDLIDRNLLESINSRVEIIRINRPVGSKNPFHVINLNRALMRFRPDVIHLHKAKIYNYLLLRFRRISCVTLHHMLVEDDMVSLSRIKYRFAISKAVAQDIASRLKLDSVVIYNGIYISDFRNAELDKCQRRGEKLNCVCVGRLMHEIKGQDILIRALSFMKPEDRRRISLDIVGEGDSYDYLRSLVSGLSLDDVVSFRGLKSQQWLYEHLCEYDLFVAPSVNEGFGLTVVEAMCAGVPVLVSDIQGPMEIIDNGKYGYHFKCGDINDCALKLLNFMKDGKNVNMTGMARQRALKLFDVKYTAESYLKEYGRIKGADSK